MTECDEIFMMIMNAREKIAAIRFLVALNQKQAIMSQAQCEIESETIIIVTQPRQLTDIH